MSDEAAKLKKEYYKNYQDNNREDLKEYLRKWRAANPKKTREYNQRYWKKKSQFN